MSGGLSRDILRWMQSLDLSYSVKNPKRDFSNGFVIAEIFSKYYRKDVEMHSFDSGSNLMKREANWELLVKFFKRVGFKLKPQQIQGVIHYQAGAAVPVVEQVYTFLTNKKVVAINLSHTMAQGEASVVPPFARPTASTKVKQRMREPDLATQTDMSAIQTRAVEAIEIHEDDLRYERVAEPERFQRTQTIARVPTRKINQTESAQPVVEFKTVQVKQLNAANFARLRASRRKGNANSSPSKPTEQSTSQSEDGAEASAEQESAGDTNTQSLFVVASNAASALLAEEKADSQAEAAIWETLKDSVREGIAEDEREKWVSLFKSISDNLVVEIPYAEHSNDALTILDSFTFTPATANAALAVFLPAEVDGEAQVAALCGVFVMLAKQAPDSQEFSQLCAFVGSVLEQGGDHEAAAMELLGAVGLETLQADAAQQLLEEYSRRTE